MSLGLGHRYWVHIIKHIYGTLEECINFMNENKPKDNKHWFELHPQVNVKEGKCKEYMCDLVELEK